MGIQTTTGLISGIDYGKLVDQLIELASVNRDNLEARTKALTDEQYAITELSALVLSVQYVTNNLAKDDIYETMSVASSQSSLISATVTGDPAEGTYRFTPLQTAQQQQLLTSGVKSNTDALGGGSMTIRFGSDVERPAPLDLFNGGTGIDRGKIRITDRSGASAEIDLSTVQTVDDVLDAINTNDQINVTAEAHGDGIRLIDNTGLELSNLKVQEVGNGTTADSLGLKGIDVAASVASGEDLVYLTEDVELDLLNDGNGIARNSALPDIVYELRDGTQGTIDFSPLNTTDSKSTAETTLGDIMEVINAGNPEKLRVEISADGERLVVHDLTDGAGTFRIESMSGTTAAEDLGIAGQSADGEITGRRLLGGLKSVLLSTLGGSNGLGSLGSLELTDRTGATDTISLENAETLEDVLDAINAAGVGIIASVNSAKTGIVLTDTTGGSASNMIVASADAMGTAETLGIAADAAVSNVRSGDLHQQVVSQNTKLADLNGGSGVRQGKIKITDSKGVTSTLNVNSSVETVGDLIKEINRLGSDVYAEINQTGDGIWIRDQAGGTGTLQIAETTTTTAADLHLLGSAKTVEIDGEELQVVDGSTTYTIELEEDESLDDLIAKINDLGGDFTAKSFVDGSRNSQRMTLTSDMTGAAGAMVVDMSGLGFTLTETAEAQDALLLMGGINSAVSGIVLTSASNKFTDVIEGVSLTVNEASTSPVTITVSSSDTDLIANVETFVTNYNRLRESLDKYTAYDAENDVGSILTSDPTALRLESNLSGFLSGRFSGLGTIQSLAQIGIDIGTDGTLSFDSTALKELFETDREAVKAFFTTEKTGFAAKFDTLAEQLAGEDSSTLTNRYLVLGQKIEKNEAKVEWMDQRLEVQKERMLMEFANMELAIAKMQSNLDYLDSITYIGKYSKNNDDD